MFHASEGHPEPSRGLLTSRPTRVVATAVAVTVGLSSALLFGGAGAASASTPRAQSVGRFLDGSAGGMALEKIVNIKDARATNPGTVTDQNPLDVSLGGQMAIPLTHKLQVPGGGVFTLGAANQVAKAQSDGYSYGASGAVANSGGASAGGNNNAYPADASIDLSQKALPSAPLTLPGAGSLPSLGGVSAHIGAVSALASTPKGVGKNGSTHYNIAGLSLTVGSPALGAVLAQVASATKAPGLPTLPTTLPGVSSIPGVPASCSFQAQVLKRIDIDGGALSIDPTDGSLTIDVAKVLNKLGLNLNNLPANTDLLAYVLKYLTSSTGLADGLEGAVTGALQSLQSSFTACFKDVTQTFPGPLASIATKLTTSFTTGQTTAENAINQVVKQLSSAAGTDPLKPLTDALKNAVQIGVNVQPNGRSGSYKSPLRATPDQSTDPINGQTIVRAIEVDLGGGQLALALANAAAGPSSAVAPESTPTTSRPATPAVTHNSVIPTGVPAGEGTRGGTSSLPLVLLSLGLLIGGGGALAFGLRRVRFGRHGS